MAQTTGAMSGAAAYVATSTDGSSWNDISGSANMVEAPEMERISGEEFTHDGDTAIVTYGKLNPVEIGVTLIYTKTAGEGWARARTSLQTAGGARLDLRWAPNGNTSGELQYTTGTARVTKLQFPSTDAKNGKPIVVKATFKTASVIEATI